MILLKNKNEIESLRSSGRIVRKILKILYDEATEGVTTLYLNDLAEKLIYAEKAEPSFKGYNSFNYSICTSINTEAIHGIPSSQILANGDLLSVDIGVFKDGFHGDAAWTKIIGKDSEDKKILLTSTKECLYTAIDNCFPGQRVGSIGNIISNVAKKNNFSVIRNYGGHGVGRRLHEYPFIPNYGVKNTGIILKAGAVIAIEPILAAGSGKTYIKHDGWTVCTEDNTLSSHFEHTVLITDSGCEILT